MGRFLDRLTRGMALVSGGFLILVMLIMFIDVIGRYFLNAPLTYSVELVELAMGLFVMFGMAQCTLHRGHISVDLLSERIVGRMLDRLFNIIAAVAGAIFMGLIAWRLLMHAIRVYEDGIFTQVLEFPSYPVVFLMFAAGVVSALVALALVIWPSAGIGHRIGSDDPQTWGE